LYTFITKLKINISIDVAHVFSNGFTATSEIIIYRSVRSFPSGIKQPSLFVTLYCIHFKSAMCNSTKEKFHRYLEIIDLSFAIAVFAMLGQSWAWAKHEQLLFLRRRRRCLVLCYVMLKVLEDTFSQPGFYLCNRSAHNKTVINTYVRKFYIRFD